MQERFIRKQFKSFYRKTHGKFEHDENKAIELFGEIAWQRYGKFTVMRWKKYVGKQATMKMQAAKLVKFMTV